MSKESSKLLPAVWLLVLIAGLPQFSETVYSPSIPEIALSLRTTESMAEHTLTIYLFAFAIGIFFWGITSDRIGRKPTLLTAFSIYALGCIGCYFSNSIEMLMASRFVQALGGSAGSVLGQAISRDSFHGAALGKVYSSVGTSLAIFPAIGPIVGGLISQYYVWNNIFLFLIICAFSIITLIAYKLPETHDINKRKKVALLTVVKNIFKDKRVLSLALIVGGCNGINFSYYAEGSFYLITMLELSPSDYGTSFILIALAAMLGGLNSRRMLDTYHPEKIMNIGLMIMICGFTITSLAITFLNLSVDYLICLTIATQMISMFGSCMVTSNSLALALVNYRHCIGTASSIFGCLYYSFISIFTFGMGNLHNGTIYPMPLYFLFISTLIFTIYRLVIYNPKTAEIK